ncbi:MAG: AsmA family protein [Pseudomonadota bacterium]
MSKSLKISMVVAGLLLLSGLSAILLIPRLVDTNTFRQQLVAQVKQQTGLELIIDGELSLSVFPWLGIEAQGIRLAQPSFIEHAEPILAVGQMAIRVRLVPLLNKQIDIDRIIMQSPKITYVVDKQGRTSLDTLKQNTAQPNPNASKPTGETESPVNTGKTADPARVFAIAGIDISDGQLTYNDQSQNSIQRIEQLNIHSGNLLSRDGAPIEFSATIRSGTLDPVNVRLTASGGINVEDQSATLSDVDLRIAYQKDLIEAAVGNIEFSALLQLATVNQISVEAGYKDLRPSLSIPSITWDISQQRTSPIAFLLAEESLAFAAEGELMLKDLAQKPMAKGHISSAPFDPLKIIKAFDIDYQPLEQTAFNTASFNTQFSAGVFGAALSKSEINLDNSRLQGNLSILIKNKTAYRFDLALNEINLDHYMPTNVQQTKEGHDKNNSTPNSGLALVAPVALIKGLNANGIFRASKIQASGAKLTDVDLNIRSTQQTMTAIAKANLYGGSLETTMDLVSNSTADNLTIKTRLSAINLEPLLTDMELSDQFSGIADITKDISIVEKDNKQSNAGTIQFFTRNGRLKNIDIKKILDETQFTIDQLRGKQVATREYKEDGTQFAEARGTLLLNNNVLTNNDLSIKAPAFRISGKGMVDLAKDELDYSTSVTVVNTNQGQGGKDRSDLKGLLIPVKFYGPLAAPDYKIDANAVLKANAKQVLAAQKKALKQKAAERLGIKTKGDEKVISTEDLKDEFKKKLLEKLF